MGLDMPVDRAVILQAHPSSRERLRSISQMAHRNDGAASGFTHFAIMARWEVLGEGRSMQQPRRPERQGLYRPGLDHDACGVGFIVHLKGHRSHKLVDDAITALEHLHHRGASGSEPNTGDGAGILVQMPHEFLRRECAQIGIRLPEAGH
ncbi:MAG: hypothetical protein C4321_01290, partial [Chloroflexota bacterium]